MTTHSKDRRDTVEGDKAPGETRQLPGEGRENPQPDAKPMDMPATLPPD